MGKGEVLRLWNTLTPGGILAVWSAHPSPDFERRLRRAGFDTSAKHVSARTGVGGKGRKETICLARRR